MQHRAIFIAIIVSLIFEFSSYAQPDAFPVLKGPYLGQKPPGKAPEIFAPGIISQKGSNESVICFANANDEQWCIFTRFSDKIPDFTAFETKLINGKWTKPEISQRFKNEGCYLHCLNHEGTKIFYHPAKSLSQYPPEIWCIDIEKDTKSKFICKGMHPTVSKNGNLYYDYDGHIARRKLEGEKYGDMEYLGENIFLKGYDDAHPCISWDEDFLIFDSSERPGVKGNDLFVSFRIGDNKWTKPVNLGKYMKMANSGLAKISPERKYIFFHSNAQGQQDFYWVDVKIIENLKQKNYLKKEK